MITLKIIPTYFFLKAGAPTYEIYWNIDQREFFRLEPRGLASRGPREYPIYVRWNKLFVYNQDQNVWYELDGVWSDRSMERELYDLIESGMEPWRAFEVVAL